MIRTGLIGFGLSGSVFHAPIIEGVDGINLVAVSGSNHTAIKDVCPGVQILLPQELILSEDIDLIIVASPNDSHYALTRMALEAGKHVVLEKPMVSDVHDGYRLLELAERSNGKLTVFHNRRWDSDFLSVKHVLDRGELGQLHTYKAHFHRYRPEPRQHWREQDADSAGVLFDLGSHLIDQALCLFGMPETVWADCRRLREGAEACDAFTVRLNYTGLVVELACNPLIVSPGPGYELHGTRGSFYQEKGDPQEGQLRTGMGPGHCDYGHGDASGELYRLEQDHSDAVKVELTPPECGCYQVFYQKLVSAIQSDAPLPVSAAEALRVIEVIDLALHSSEERRAVHC